MNESTSGQTSAHESLEEQAVRLLRQLGLTVSAAESCTGGLILHRLTNIAGSSAFIRGGVVAYANEAKVKYVGVREKTLELHGAVSRETALEMARGAREGLLADVALSVTGIAGPGGATPTKPVGLTYVAISTPLGEEAVEHRWSGDRVSNKIASADAALTMLCTYLESESARRSA